MNWVFDYKRETSVVVLLVIVLFHLYGGLCECVCARAFVIPPSGHHSTPFGVGGVMVRSHRSFFFPLPSSRCVYFQFSLVSCSQANSSCVRYGWRASIAVCLNMAPSLCEIFVWLYFDNFEGPSPDLSQATRRRRPRRRSKSLRNPLTSENGAVGVVGGFVLAQRMKCQPFLEGRFPP